MLTTMNINFKIASIENISMILGMMQKFYSIDNYPFNSELSKENLIKFINTTEFGRLWLIQINKITVGYVVLTFGFSFEYKGQDAFIDELYLDNNFRNQGIGKKTLEFLNIQAKKIGINAIHLEVEKHNKKGSELYKRNGYRVTKRTLMTKIITE